MTTTPGRLTTALADRYRIERTLGKGGMATVYLARDARHDRDVAMKVLNAELAESLGRQRFLREIRLAAKLNHPHILPLYDSGESDGFLYFVTPVMQGQTLRNRLETERTLPVEEAVRIAAEIADALDYAHRQDVVHRDIKPENILLHEGHAVVADFGIGKAVAAAAAESATFTQIGVTGALGYTYALVGRFDDAAVHARWMQAHTPDLSYTMQLSSLVDAAQGRRESALTTLARGDVAGLDAHQTFHVSESYAMAGNTTRALELLEFAVDHGMYPYRFYAEFCPFMAPLRGMPEFDRIVAKAARRVAEFSA